MRDSTRDQTRRFLTLSDAERDYPVSKRKLWTLISEGRLKAYKLDRKTILCRDDIERLLTAQPVNIDIDKIVDETLGELGASK